MDYMHSNGPLKRQTLFMGHTTKSINVDDPIPLEDVNESNYHQGQKDGSIYFEDKTVLQDDRSFCDVASRNEFSSNQSQQNIRNVIFEINNKLNRYDEKSDKSKRISINQQKCLQKQHQSEKSFLSSPQKICKVENLNEIQQIQEITNNSSKYNHESQTNQKIINVPKSYSIFGQVKINLIVKKFVNKLMQTLDSNVFQQIPEKQFNIINDPSFCYQFHHMNDLSDKQKSQIDMHKSLSQIQFNYSQRVNSLSSFLNSSNYVFMPESLIVFVWNVFNLLMIIYNSFEAIILLGFNKNTVYPLYVESIVFYFLDCLIQMNIAIFRKGQIITQRKIIINTFMKEQLIYTVLGMIGIILSANFKYCKMLFLIRSLQIPIIYREIESKLNIRIKMKHQSELLKLIFFILSVAHLVGCSFRFVGLMEISQGYDKTWLGDSDQDNWVYDYINCIYWAVVTMVTLGYGDIIPITIAERFFTIFIVLISCGVFGYCINQVGMIIQSIGKERENFNQTMDKLNIFMKERKFNLQIQMKIRKHFEYKFRIQNKNSIQIDQLLDQMHESLKYETLKELYKKMLQQTSIFIGNFSDVCIDELSQYIQEINLVPDEFLYQAEEQSDLIYFVLKGEFTVIPKDDQVNRILSIEKKGSIIGQYEFISQKQREFSVKSRDFSCVAVIDYQSFIKVLQKHPKDYETFCFIKDNIQFCSCLNKTDIKCSFCQVNDHTINYCKKYQFIPNILNKIKNQKSTIQLSRQQFSRKKKFKWNSFKNIYQMSFYANKFLEKLQSQQRLQQQQQSDSSLTEDTSSQTEDIRIIDSQNQLEQQYVTQVTQSQKRASLVLDDIISPTKKNLRQVGSKLPSTTQIKENEPRASTKKISFILSTNDLENGQEIQILDKPEYTKNNLTEKQPLLHSQLENMYKSEKSPVLIRRESGKKELTMMISQNKLNQAYLINQLSQSGTQHENNDFDLMKEYKIYFPSQNCVQILKEYNLARKKKLQKMKVQTKTSFSGIKKNQKTIDQKNNKTSRTSLPSQIQSQQFLQK
ncbi:cyclic nucleotide-binding domain protein (macronuclear) [Tetrahymena thermophila SB210]|uniref:Cyclic nucleotide-binding domain protein n=1 Tax=Tetrahymena thermophila (strain SB210) TaxID=312017 RepID=I7LX17_TETTS|nr:cyclic nucleotide-binding domain protein [Tetrahymena thermophila SB210]EAS03266.3 cyclic nucleotide-binding domain protein [Tetrahymena thermophila SB210]|eukprot:XP_001023511.3 cyclic nucleotide-binding domain protein [Tetrahymena thermophila SB210]